VSNEARVSRARRGHWTLLVCGCSLAFACAIDNRSGNIVAPPSGDGESGASNLPSGSAGASNDLPGAVPEGSVPNTAGAGGRESGGSTPELAPPLNGGGGVSGSGDAGSASMLGSSGSGTGPAGAAGTGTDPGETEVIGGCFNQLLANAGFERGHTRWTETSEAVHDVIVRRDTPLLTAAGVTPQAGDYLAWIGGIPNGDFLMYESTLLQTVSIPAEVVSLTLSGYYWVSQPEMGGMQVDWAVLEAEDPDPNVTTLWVVKRFDNETNNNSNGWVHFEETLLDNVSALASKTLTVRAKAIPNGNGTLSLWLDSLRLEARCTR
jgi:hypothetical protein